MSPRSSTRPPATTSTTSTPTRPTCSPTAGRRRTSSSRTGRRSGSAPRCTPATCRCCAACGRRDRRVPQRLRRLAGPRPDPAGRRRRSPPPAAASRHLPLLTYHWRNVSSSVSRASDTLDTAIGRGRQAVQEQCDRLGLDASVVHGAVEGCYRLVRTALRRRHADHGGRRHSRRAGRRAPLPPGGRRPRWRRLHTTMARRPPRRRPPGRPAERPSSTCSTRPPATVGRAGPGRLVGASPSPSTGRCRPTPAKSSSASPPASCPTGEPDWLETLAGLARSAGRRTGRGLVATTGGVVVHAGWDTPNYRWYELEGMRGRHHQLGQRPVHRARVQPGDARRRGHRHTALARAEAHRRRGDGLGHRRPGAVGCARRQRPGHAVDPLRPLRPSGHDELKPPPARPG